MSQEGVRGCWDGKRRRVWGMAVKVSHECRMLGKFMIHGMYGTSRVEGFLHSQSTDYRIGTAGIPCVLFY